MNPTRVVVLLLLAACSSAPDKSTQSPQPPAASAPKRTPMDTLCFNDCLGAGTSREVCEERCNY